MDPASGTLIDYFQRELEALRGAGAGFARKYPGVAASLALGEHGTSDPHVERLIESVAFLTARIRQNLDDDYADMPAALLDALYPALVRPVPAMAIARFAVDAAAHDLAGGYPIARGTPLYARTGLGIDCTFRTAQALVLHPLEVTGAALEPPEPYGFLDRRPEVVRVIRLSLATLIEGASFQSLGIGQLRLHLAGERAAALSLFDALAAHCEGVALLPAGDPAPSAVLGRDALQLTGFAPEEAVLPTSSAGHDGYRLLQEYFCFPEKFLFLDLAGLDRVDAGACDVLFLIGRSLPERLRVSRSSFTLHCAPVVNLFERTSEPVRLTERHYEYRLVADARFDATTEIHSILKLSASSDPDETGGEVAPFYGYDHAAEVQGCRSFWIARRVAAERPGVTGTDLMLSFVDGALRPERPPVRTVFAHTLCTNRALAEQVPCGAVLEIEDDVPVETIALLTKPTLPVTPPLPGGHLWRLVSQLSLNHLSLQGPAALPALREILRLHAPPGRDSAQQQIAGLRELAARDIQLRVGEDAWRGFRDGVEITLTLDERCFVGASSFLFGALLNRFFALYAAANSCTRLCIRHSDQTWSHAWPPMAGARPLL